MSNKCPKCDGEMKKGLIADQAHGSLFAHPVWVEKIEWLGLKGKKKKVNACACVKCGYIEQYVGKS